MHLMLPLIVATLTAALATASLTEEQACQGVGDTRANSLLQVKAKPQNHEHDVTEERLQVFDSGVVGLGEVQYEPAFFAKCLGQWQENCRARFAKDPESNEMLCENNLDRGYLKARLLVPKERLREHFDHSSKALQGRNKTIYEGLRLPKYTEEGYKKSRVPDDLQERLAKWFESERHNAQPESPEVTGKWCNNDYDNDDFVLPFGKTKVGDDLIQKELRPIVVEQLREWAQVELDDNPIIYGARMYHRGSICAMHTDEVRDHIISVIYHLNQRGLEEEWPLTVMDHGGQERTIYSKPGDLIFYESASTPHGRKSTLLGEEFANVFFHFKPKNWTAAKDAAYLSMLPYEAKETYEEPEFPAVTFRSDDACLPYGTGDSFSAAYNTTLMRLPFTHLGFPAEPSVNDAYRTPK